MNLKIINDYCNPFSTHFQNSKKDFSKLNGGERALAIIASIAGAILTPMFLFTGAFAAFQFTVEWLKPGKNRTADSVGEATKDILSPQRSDSDKDSFSLDKKSTSSITESDDQFSKDKEPIDVSNFSDEKLSKFTGIGIQQLSDGGKYVGEFVKGKWHGQATFINKNGVKFEGEYNNGNIHNGRCTSIKNDHYHIEEYENGQLKKTYIYHKDCDTTFPLNGKLNGQAKIRYPNGYTLEGEFVNGVTNDTAKWTFPANDDDQRKEFVGVLNNWKPDGQGVLTYNNGKIYSGDFKDGLLNGKGKIQNTNGYTLEGEFVNGKISADPKWTFPQNDQRKEFIGHLDGNWQPSGQGTLIYHNGLIYSGDFKNGLLNGKGKIQYTNGYTLEGKFVLGNCNVEAKWTFPKDSPYKEYLGYLDKQFQPSDQGTLTHNDGSYSIGRHSNSWNIYHGMHVNSNSSEVKFFNEGKDNQQAAMAYQHFKSNLPKMTTEQLKEYGLCPKLYDNILYYYFCSKEQLINLKEPIHIRKNLQNGLSRSLVFIPSGPRRGLHILCKDKEIDEVGVGAFNRATVALHIEKMKKEVCRSANTQHVPQEESAINAEYDSKAEYQKHFVSGTEVKYTGPWRDRKGRTKGSPKAGRQRDANINKTLLIMDHIPGGELYEITKTDPKNRPKDQTQKKNIGIAQKIAEGLVISHKDRYVNMDNKTANIFMDGSNPKMGDFGSVHKAGEKKKGGDISITPGYIPPEWYDALNNGKMLKIQTANEIWSLGCIIAEITKGRAFINLTGQINGPLNNNLTTSGKENFEKKVLESQLFPNYQIKGSLDWIIYNCLQYNPKDRLTAKEVNQYLTDLYALAPKDAHPSNTDWNPEIYKKVC